MSESTVESPLALKSDNTQVEFLSYSFMICSLGIEYHRGARTVRLSLTTPLHDISSLLYSVCKKSS